MLSPYAPNDHLYSVGIGRGFTGSGGGVAGLLALGEKGRLFVLHCKTHGFHQQQLQLWQVQIIKGYT